MGGVIIVLIEYFDDDKNLGNWHPIKTAKFFTNNFTGLPQGSYLSPILVNVYMSIIEMHLSLFGHKCLIYADDLVIFLSNKYVNLDIKNLNSAVKNLNGIIIKVPFGFTPERSKLNIFTRFKFLNHPNIYLKNNIILIFS